MEAKFYWLKHRPRSENTSLVETPDLPSDFPPGRGDMKFWDCLMEQKICSGHTIVMRTDDPINRPLPSEELLGMQWHLNRLAAISGVSEIPDPQQPVSNMLTFSGRFFYSIVFKVDHSNPLFSIPLFCGSFRWSMDLRNFSRHRNSSIVYFNEILHSIRTLAF
jgi:hypothetical protein